MNVADIFPETLLVSRAGSRIYTDSLRIAEHFGKSHDNVLKVIRRVMEQSPEAELLVNFNEQLISYDMGGKRRGKRMRTVFELTRDGFCIITMSFTGEKALDWKWKFLAAFNDMERQLASRDRRYVRALAQVRPSLIPVVEMTKKGLCRAAIAAPLGKSPASITYHRRAARALGLLS